MIYQETQDGSFTFEGMCIPKAEGNRHYQEMVERLASGEATVQHFDHSAAAAQKAVNVEVSWVNQALSDSDIELAYVQDSDRREVGTVAEWRAYRRELRDYITKDEFGNYTVGIARPVSPRGPFEL